MTDILLRFPASWPAPLVAGVCMLTLAALDFAGALAAAEWVARRSTTMMVIGILAFVVLFWFYASALQYAELAVVTFGWIVFLQISIVVLDRFRYEVHLPTGKLIAVVIIIAAQAYLMLGPGGEPGTGHPEHNGISAATEPHPIGSARPRQESDIR
jgi:hypothetical protein